MGERPEMQHASEETEKSPPKNADEHSEALGKMISETLASGEPVEKRGTEPLDESIKPLTIAEFQSTRQKQQKAEEDWKKEQEVRLEIDRVPPMATGYDKAPDDIEPSGLELDMRTALKPATPSERRIRSADESMQDVLSMKKAAEKPPMHPKKKKGLLSWLRGE